MSNIEIKIYSSNPIYDTQNTKDLLYYTETYVYSVYTDKNGNFRFNKPSEYCSISIVLDSLPANYGVSKQTLFIVPSNTTTEIELFAVCDVSVTLCNGNLTPSILNLEGNSIFASYTIIPSKESVFSSTINNTEKNDLSLELINSLSSHFYRGIVQVDSKKYDYAIKEDITEMSLVDKINFLSSTGELTEFEKISLYCDLLTSNDFTIQSGTSIYDEISKYKNSNLSSKNELLSKINEISRTTSERLTQIISKYRSALTK